MKYIKHYLYRLFTEGEPIVGSDRWIVEFNACTDKPRCEFIYVYRENSVINPFYVEPLLVCINKIYKKNIVYYADVSLKYSSSGAESILDDNKYSLVMRISSPDGYVDDTGIHIFRITSFVLKMNPPFKSARKMVSYFKKI